MGFFFKIKLTGFFLGERVGWDLGLTYLKYNGVLSVLFLYYSMIFQVLLNNKVVEDSHNTGEKGATDKQPLVIPTGKGAVIPGQSVKGHNSSLYE